MRTFPWGLIRAGARTPNRALPVTRPLSSSASPKELSLKNVTKSNFESALAELRRRVKDADFVAIDLEMTGVTSAPWREVFVFDRSDIQYLKIKDSAEKFAVLQFGVCPFRWNSQSNCFIAHPFNFYIFPRKEVPNPIGGSWNEFLCQTSSLEFLARHHFDFNYCITEGISYLSRSQELEAMGQVATVYGDEFSDPSSILRKSADEELARMADILFFERMKIVIRQWYLSMRVGSQGSSSSISLNNSIPRLQTTFVGIRPALVLSGLNTRQLRLTKLVIAKHFKDLCYVDAIDGTSYSQPLLVYTESVSDRNLLNREVKSYRWKKAEENIKAAVGFRHVIDLLSSERKLIVGHNCFLDLAHVYSKFFGPLPSTAEEFVAALQMHFPFIIDTKLLLNSDDALVRIINRAGTSLDTAFHLLCQPVVPTDTSSGFGDKPSPKVEVHVDDLRFSIWNTGTKHEAGYDAFMTGCIFSEACFQLGINYGLGAAYFVQNEKLKSYINRLYLSWINGDIINLETGKTAASSRRLASFKIEFSRIVILWGEASKLRMKDVRYCFSKAFGMGSVTCFYHLDESAILVQFSKEEFVAKFFQMMDTLQGTNSPISMLHPLSKIFDGNQVHAGTYEMYKELCGSPISEVMFSDQVQAVGVHQEAVVLSSSTPPPPIQKVKEDTPTSEKECQIDSSTVCLKHQIEDYFQCFDAQLSN